MRLEAHHIGIIVSDLARSKAFYGALGFEPVAERSDDTKTISFLSLGRFTLELFAYNDTPPALECAGRVLGFRHLALTTDDLDAALGELRMAGVVTDDLEVREIEGVARLAFFRDPDGIEIEITQDLASGVLG